MGDIYQLYNRLYNYKGGYGNCDKKKASDFTISDFEKSFIPIEEQYAKIGDCCAGLITSKGLESRIKRDLAIDAQNPQEKLPEDAASALMINTVGPFSGSYPPDLSKPQDFELNDNVRMVQQAFLNASKQQQLYESPEVMNDPSYNTDGLGKGNDPSTQTDVYQMDGSAAGRETNFLAGEHEDESYRKNSIETMVAF